MLTKTIIAVVTLLVTVATVNTAFAETSLTPINSSIGLEKTVLPFSAPKDNKLPWGFVEGKVANPVEGHPVIIQIFKNGEPVHFAQTDVKNDGSFEQYGHDYGWKMKPSVFRGETDENVMVHETPATIPQNVSRIWYAPDHVRAWRMTAYVLVDGHNASQKICDDQDLMARLYKIGPDKFHYIPECLYKYRVHGQNTWLKNNSEIQSTCLQMHDANIYDMALAYWRSKSFGCYDLGGGISCPEGWTSVDVHDAEVNADLNKKWPFNDNSVGVFRAHDFIEHIKDQIHVMNEAYRCLAHGGLFMIEVPSTDGRGAFQDPSHVSFWNENSFWYYTKEQQQRYIRHLGINAKFQAIRIVTYYPSKWHQENKIPYVRAHLAAIKSGKRLHGLIEV